MNTQNGNRSFWKHTYGPTKGIMRNRKCKNCKMQSSHRLHMHDADISRDKRLHVSEFVDVIVPSHTLHQTSILLILVASRQTASLLLFKTNQKLVQKGERGGGCHSSSSTSTHQDGFAKLVKEAKPNNRCIILLSDGSFFEDPRLRF